MRTGPTFINPYLHKGQFYNYQKQRVGNTERFTYVRIKVDDHIWIKDAFDYSEFTQEHWIFNLAKAYVPENLWEHIVPSNAPAHVSDEELSNRLKYYENYVNSLGHSGNTVHSASAWNPNDIDSLLGPMSALNLQRRTDNLRDNYNLHAERATNALATYLDQGLSTPRMLQNANSSSQRGNNAEARRVRQRTYRDS
ncbi:uncharacterized protein LOC117175151 [Belonocnema kinseyi]|uniref:uncharacterized protein LOC117175151 n=1 Tax=Belonocnema kinseyi TaxID=2817044 RepID=UPI00143E002E|nr:uncharacterized protein LOC117175151 [Belonocnema kinseyi]